jgi:hypothetical protein
VKAARTSTVPAWNVQEGDVSPGGAVVVSVTRVVSTGHVRIGFSNETSMLVPGERRLSFTVLSPR